MTLGSKQLAIATAIIRGAYSRNLGRQGAKVALMTALQESGLRMYANSNVPDSLNYPHDAVGSDYDSLNPFQQRVKYWGTVAQLMNLDYAINAFYTALVRVPGWAVMRPGVAAQRVQVSAYPDAYNKWESAADTLLDTLK